MLPSNSKYRYMEVNLQQKRKGLEVKIPDISKTLDVVRFLEARRVSDLRLDGSYSLKRIIVTKIVQATGHKTNNDTKTAANRR